MVRTNARKEATLMFNVTVIGPVKGVKWIVVSSIFLNGNAMIEAEAFECMLRFRML